MNRIENTEINLHTHHQLILTVVYRWLSEKKRLFSRDGWGQLILHVQKQGTLTCTTL
jgi:hypothetical protein